MTMTNVTFDHDSLYLIHIAGSLILPIGTSGDEIVTYV